MKKYLSALFCLLIVALFLFAGCVKRKPNETADEHKARKVPVYVAQSYTGLLGLTDYTEAWTRQGELNPAAAQAIYRIDEDARKALDELAVYLQNPKGDNAQQKISAVVLALQRAREANVIRFKNERARAIFDGVISNGLLLLSHIQWELIGGQKPRDLSGAISETILITADLQARIQRQAGMSAAEAWDESRLLSGEIESKNLSRLGNLN